VIVTEITSIHIGASLNLTTSFLAFTGTDPVAFAEWFLAAVGLVIVVTFIYVFVLNKSPPPAGVTVEKLEHQSDSQTTSGDASVILSQTHSAMLTYNFVRATELAALSATLTLGNLFRANGGDPSGMNVSDLAYLIQTKAKNAPQISQPLYQLNMLRLKAAQGQPITQAEAEWAISMANWVIQIVDSHQISF
jgi:hypothetical protein